MVLAVSSLAAFLAFLDVTIVNIAFPAIAAAFPTSSPADLSWIFTAYNVTFAALLVPAGRLADLRGRRRAFLGGLALFGVASAACAAAPTVGVLVAARALQAVAAALLAPSSLALLLPAFPPERRGFAVGTWGAMGGIAAATGPALGGVLVDGFGWRAVFLANLPVVALTLVAGTIVLAESRDRGARLPDPAGVLLLGAGVALLAWGIVGGETSWTAPATVARLAGGLAGLGVFVWRNGRVATPLVELALFRVPAFRVAIVGYLVFSAAFYALLLANVLYLTGVWHYAVLAAGLAVTPGPLMAAAASAVGGRLSDRFGARAVLVPGALLFAAGCALFAGGMGSEPGVSRPLPARDAAHRHRGRCRLLRARRGHRRGVAREPVRHRQRGRHLRPADRRGVRDLGVAVGPGGGRSVSHGLGAHGGGRRGHRARGHRGRPGPAGPPAPSRPPLRQRDRSPGRADLRDRRVRVAGRGVAAVMSVAASAAPAAATNTTV